MENVLERKVMWGDLDSLGIVFYPRYYEWMDASGHLFFEAINLNQGDLWQERNILFGLVETRCRYLMAGRYHQKIRIVTTIEALGTKTVLLKHRFEAPADTRLMAEGFEKRICLDARDPRSLNAMDIPPDIREVLQSAMPEEARALSSIPV